jgi:hypothetical protein
MGDEAMRQAIWTRQGRLQFGIELKIVTEDAEEAPMDGETSGALMVRGPAGLPWIAAPSSAYLISGDRVWLTGDAFVHL